MKRKVSGTLEWALGGYNFVKGCEHGCRYCYARYDAIKRHHRVANAEEWKCPVVLDHKLKPTKGKINWYTENNKPPKDVSDVTIMCPTTHDILPEYVDQYIEVAQGIFDLGYNLLIVSKPHLECIEKICAAFEDYKKRILFRFTIGSIEDAILKFWEPNAPGFSERFASLQHAYRAGFATSVSCEPMLDAPEITKLVKTLTPFCTDSIWIGKMNDTNSRVFDDDKQVKEGLAWIEENQTDEKIFAIYEKLKGHPLVKWKESIKEVVGLDLAEEAGLDQ